MRYTCGLIAALILLNLAPLAWAVRVPSIYQDDVPVATQDPGDKLQGEQDALGDVFVKVSGNAHILDNNPNLKANLNEADDYVQEYGYSTPPDAPKSTPFLLFVRFDADAVNRMLQEAGTPIWGQNRPLILVWLAMTTPQQPLDFVDSGGLLPKLLKDTGKQRGLPMIFPMLDVTDLSLVSVSDLSAKSYAALQQASQRYDSNALLIGNITQNKNGFNSHWQLVLDDKHWVWDLAGKTMQDVFTSVVDAVGDTLAARYGVITTDNTADLALTLTITGVKQHADLLQLVKYLQHLTPVADVQLKNVAGNEITLDVSLRSSRDSFVQAVSLSKSLQPVAVTNAADGALSYKWAQ
jgi:hypothetical protein